MPRYLVADLPTPAFLVDLDILEANLRAMAVRCRGLGVRLRPHVKTHKCLEIGRLQRDAGAAGITVATLVEARVFAAAGFDDITWAVPVTPGRIAEVVELARRVTLRVLVDSEAAARRLSAAAREAGLTLHVWLEVDCGYHRTGVDPAEPASRALAAWLAVAPSLVLDGILTHAGHGYDAPNRAALERVAREERDVMVAFATALRNERIAVPAVSIGSTPTMAAHRDLAGIDEVRPGNYAFFDWMQAGSGVCRPEDVAVSVLASVISHQPGADTVFVDAGALAMSKDTGPKDPARARGLGPLYAGLAGTALEPRVSLASVSQEHGFVRGAAPADVEGRFAVGDLVRILPNHSCLTAAQFDQAWAVRGASIADCWTIHRGR